MNQPLQYKRQNKTPILNNQGQPISPYYSILIKGDGFEIYQGKNLLAVGFGFVSPLLRASQLVESNFNTPFLEELQKIRVFSYTEKNPAPVVDEESEETPKKKKPGRGSFMDYITKYMGLPQPVAEVEID